MFDQPAVIVDLETTGANASEDRITEVGVIEVAGGEVLGEWSTLVNPQAPIPPFIETMTGITNAMVRSAPAFGDLADELAERLGGRLFIAHNARFDYGFIRNEFRRIDRPFRETMLCTVKLSRRLWPEHRSHGLDAIIARHGIACEARHRALGDARALWRFLRFVRGEFPAGRLDAVVRELTRGPATPPHLDPERLAAIPDAPGVYRFLGESGAVLYTGKSVSLRSRVLAHFAADHASAKDMRLSLEVRDVDWIATAGELGALLAESRIVKDRLPLHNRRLRRTRELWSLRMVPALPIGAHAVEVAGAETLDLDRLDEHFGLFRSRRTAEQALHGIAAEHGLCHKLIGLDQRPGPCFAHQVGKCRGACVGRETPQAHNLRLLTALMPLRLRTWPYRGRIGIREHDPRTDRTDLHVVDRWCHVGTAATEADLEALLASGRTPEFDPDVYRILARHLAAVPRAAVIELD